MYVCCGNVVRELIFYQKAQGGKVLSGGVALLVGVVDICALTRLVSEGLKVCCG